MIKAPSVLLLFVALTGFGQAATALGAPVSSSADEEKPQILKTSPSGAFRIIQSGEDFWIVSAADEKRRTKMHSAELAIPEEFRFSPDEKWLYVELHHGSCLSGADLYRHSESKAAEPFHQISPALEDGAWAAAMKQRLFGTNYAEEGGCAMVRFGAWSADSARLLLSMRGGDARNKTFGRYLYYSTRLGKFETTPFLAKVNATGGKSRDLNVLACAEPVDSLPDEAVLKEKLATADRLLNETYQKVLHKPDNQDIAAQLKESQREWIKERDGGLQIYLGALPNGEKERRRLQFLADAARTRAEMEEDAATGNP